MYSYKISPEAVKINETEEVDTENQSTNVPTTADDLLKSFGEVDSAFGATSKISEVSEITPLDLQKMEYSEPTDEKISENAINALNDYKTSSIENIESSADVEKANLDASKDTLSENAESQIKQSESIYAKAKDNTEKDAIRRGLARSSIVINKLDAFTKAQIDDYKAINENLTDSLSKIESDIANLEIKKQNSLNNFNITYAIKLNEKITALKADEEEKQEEVIKYNNQIAEKEAEYENAQKAAQEKTYAAEWERQLKLAEYQNKYGSTPASEKIEAEKYALALNYFNSISKEQALSELNSNPTFKAELGNSYFTLYNLLNKRSS